MLFLFLLFLLLLATPLNIEPAYFNKTFLKRKRNKKKYKLKKNYTVFIFIDISEYDISGIIRKSVRLSDC